MGEEDVLMGVEDVLKGEDDVCMREDDVLMGEDDVLMGADDVLMDEDDITIGEVEVQKGECEDGVGDVVVGEQQSSFLGNVFLKEELDMNKISSSDSSDSMSEAVEVMERFLGLDCLDDAKMANVSDFKERTVDLDDFCSCPSCRLPHSGVWLGRRSSRAGLKSKHI